MSKTVAMLKLARFLAGPAPARPRKKVASNKAVMKLAAALGAYTADSAADVVADDQIIQGLSRNRHKHPFHYMLNPFVGGPISEIGHRLDRRVNASRATSPTMRIMSAGFPINPLSLAGYPAAMLAGGAKRRGETRELYEKHIAPHDIGPEGDAATVKKYDEEAEAKKKPKEEKKALFSPDGPYAVDQSAKVLALDKMLAGNRYNQQNHNVQWWANPLVGGPLGKMFHHLDQRNAATKATSPLAAVGSNLPLYGELGIGDGVSIGASAGDIGGVASAALGGARRRNDARETAGRAGVGKKPEKKPEKKKSEGKK